MTVDGTEYAVHAVELEPGQPVAGSLKAVLQLITGRDAVTGERLSRFDELIGIGLGILPGGRGAQKLPKIIRVAERLELRHSNVLSTREIARRLERRETKGVGKATDKAPDFVVSPGGTAFPVPKGATGPTPVVNPGGKTTGTAFTGGKGGWNGQVDTIRIMNPTPPRGKSPGYPKGYIKYESKAGQGVDPYTGRTLSNKNSHFPID
ncbi:MAG: hypothetical protein D6706_20430 [Chloroflexi bacterium]|nr:MAG: hypothetical protein D6706_20430 [Chloroflexota bacterium]